MESMEARGRLSLPRWGKRCAGRWDNFTFAPDCNLSSRSRTSRVGEAADDGGLTGARGLPWTGESRLLVAPGKVSKICHLIALFFFFSSNIYEFLPIRLLGYNLLTVSFSILGSVGHSVSSVFVHSTWTWMSKSQYPERHVLAAGRRRGAFPSHCPGLCAWVTTEQVTLRATSL